MPGGDERLRQKAVKLLRDTEVAWEDFEASRAASRIASARAASRFARTAGRAETALLRVVCSAPDDPGPRLAYGEVTSRRSRLAMAAGGRLAAAAAVHGARAALWAFDRDGLSDPDPQHVAQLAHEPPVVTEFTAREWVTRLLSGEERVSAAADARFALAERLATLQPRPGNDAVTPGAIDATFRAHGKLYGGDEMMVWSCRLRSCSDQDAVGEARILVMEAARIYRVLADVSFHITPEDVRKAEERRDAVLDRFPRDFR